MSNGRKIYLRRIFMMNEGCCRINKFENKQIRQTGFENRRLASLIRLLYRAFYDEKADFWRIMLKLKKYVGKHYKEFKK